MMLTCERVRELLHYDQETGVLRWRVNRDRAGRAKAGDVAGRPNKDGHLRLKIDSRKYFAHRLIWLYMTGEWPKDQIDHKDGDPSNNRWPNLREATRGQNMRNRKVQANNRLGIAGVSAAYGKYRATIMVDGKAIYLGTFDTATKAAAVRRAAMKDLHGEFARTS